jgi:membrane peptidoglycan carboxypeptidase
VISRNKAERTKKMDLGLKVQPAKNGCLNSSAPFFCDYAVNWLLHDRRLGKTVEERKKLLKSGGLVIHTTLNMDDQVAADKAVRDHVAKQDQAVGAMAMVEPGTGHVLALAQSRPMGRDEKAGETFLNYTVPTKYGDSAGFQAGSTFKPFVLAAAVNKGVPLSTTFNAPRTMTIPQDEFQNCPGAPNFAGEWTLSSSTIDGPMNVYVGTQKSVNTFYAMLERVTGVCEPFRIAKKLGVELTDPKGDSHGYGAERVPTFTLGIPNASPMEMAEAYATFGARGLHCDSHPVTSIDDSQGTEIQSYPDKCTQALPQATADAVNDVLRGVQEPGGFGYDLGGTGLRVPSAGKTGTTQDGKSVWFVGYTPQVATAAMIAGASKDGQRPIPLAGQTIHGNYIYSGSVTGSGFAGPMWAQAMHIVDDHLDYEDFVQPSSAAVQGVPTTVPTTSGMTMSEALSTLKAAGFTPIDAGTAASGNPPGTVAYTSPAGGSSAPSGSVVTVYESTGVPPPPPPGSGGHGGGGGHGNGGGHGHGNGGGRR